MMRVNPRLVASLGGILPSPVAWLAIKLLLVTIKHRKLFPLKGHTIFVVKAREIRRCLARPFDESGVITNPAN
jgi:hypothetical protein